MKLRDLFDSDVTRDIPPVVYFHEQAPAKLAEEVGDPLRGRRLLVPPRPLPE